jgi:hypothetical protein
MSSPIRRAFNAHRKVHQKLAGVEITVTRGLNTSSVITATAGFTGETNFDELGQTLFTKHRDYLINIEDYDVGSGAVAPSRHDVITEVINGLPVTFEVTLANQDAAANYDNRDRTLWRVHTKEL